uniref:CHK kinase-like domain-containing protein n=1 Tax=Lygus hesperus TaxID=30085 RepID=A0A146KVM1_LYGHE
MWRTMFALYFAIPAFTAGDQITESATMPNFITSDVGRTWLELLMKREGFKNDVDVERVTSMSFSPFDPPGVNFGSNRTRVEMTLLLKSCETVNTSVLVVDFPDSILRKKQLHASGLFDRDINVYERILPKMNDFLFNRSNYAKRMWTKAIDLRRPLRLVLNNVENNGYKRKDKTKGLNMEHCKVAVEDLAKFHALSAVLESQGEINVEDFDLSLSQRNAKQIGDWYGKVYKEFANSIRATWGPEWKSAAQQIDEKAKTITEDYLKLLKRDDSKFNALLNGDFTINNLFFNYGCSQEESPPKSSKVINFQNAFWNSPALDLQLFLNTSPEPEIIMDDSRRDKIITYYASQLRAFSELYGLKEKIVTVEDIKSEMSRTELVGFSKAMNDLSGIYLKPEDAPYTEQFIIDALKNKEIRIDSKGMFHPRFIEVMKKLVTRAQTIGII